MQKASEVPRDVTGSHPSADVRDAALVRARARTAIGGLELTVCSDGPFLLDGGAMFGVVPKTLWSQRAPADEQNRVLLGLNTLIVRASESNAVVVIETGIGNKQSPKMREILGNHERLPESFKAASVSQRDVTHVVNTHLHFDHCGWNTTLLESGEVVPTFPHARYFCAAGELAHGREQLDRDKVSYLAANYDPVIANGQMTVLDLDGEGAYVPDDVRLAAAWNGTALPPVRVQTSAEIVPGVRVERFPGHTAHMLVVHIESGGEHACFVGDLIPTHNHLQPTWVMGFDLDPLRCIEERKRFLGRAIAEDWLVVFPHDHQVPMARLRWDEKGRAVVRD